MLYGFLAVQWRHFFSFDAEAGKEKQSWWRNLAERLDLFVWWTEVNHF